MCCLVVVDDSMDFVIALGIWWWSFSCSLRVLRTITPKMRSSTPPTVHLGWSLWVWLRISRPRALSPGATSSPIPSPITSPSRSPRTDVWGFGSYCIYGPRSSRPRSSWDKPVTIRRWSRIISSEEISGSPSCKFLRYWFNWPEIPFNPQMFFCIMMQEH